MHNLDLRDFAEHSAKIPSRILHQKLEAKKIGTAKVLTAHVLDFLMVSYVTTFVAVLLSGYGQSLLISSRLMQISGHKAQLPASAIFPALLFAYFFFCNFFNHGQTWGMLSLKLRVRMQEKDFKQSFKWAAWSFLLCASAGILAPLYNKVIHVDRHDWLYQELITEKDWQTVNLLEATSVVDEEEEVPVTLAA